MSSQVWPKARPASWPLAHTRAPAPAVAPRPTARSWSTGLVNGGASGGRCPPGESGGQPSCHIRATPRWQLLTIQKPVKLLARDSPLTTDLPAGEPAFFEASVVRPHRHPSEPRRLGNGVGQDVAIRFDDEVCGRLGGRRATISLHAEPPISRAWPRRGAVRLHRSINRRGSAAYPLAGVSPDNLPPSFACNLQVLVTLPYLWLSIKVLHW